MRLTKQMAGQRGQGLSEVLNRQEKHRISWETCAHWSTKLVGSMGTNMNGGQTGQWELEDLSSDCFHVPSELGTEVALERTQEEVGGGSSRREKAWNGC